ncbi:MAG: ABC transporter permease [Anaerolineae bacterium]|nr:ABC transporter permease [Anaerolineae bacterium]
MNLGTIWAIAMKDMRQSFRDRIMVITLIVLPLMQLLLLAQTTSGADDPLPIALLDYDRTSESRAFIALLAASSRLRVASYPETWDEGIQELESGSVYGLVVLPAGMASSLYDPNEVAVVQLVADATTTLTARVVEAGVQQVMLRFTQQHRGTQTVGVQVQAIMQYNPSVRSRPNSIGAQLALITYEITLVVSALGFTREREVGTLEQLMVTPVRRHELLLGKALSPILIGLINFSILLPVVHFFFGVPMFGSLPFLFGGSLLFIVVEVLWGTFISSHSGTQQQAILLVFIQAMTDVALSGFLVPVKDMPPVFQFFANFSPLRYFLTFVRAVMLKGATLPDMLPNLIPLALLGVGVGLATTLSLSRRLG